MSFGQSKFGERAFGEWLDRTVSYSDIYDLPWHDFLVTHRNDNGRSRKAGHPQPSRLFANRANWHERYEPAVQHRFDTDFTVGVQGQ